MLMLERLAREREYPLKWIDVSLDGTRDTEVVHKVHSVYDQVHMRFELTGVDEGQAQDLVETFKGR